LLGEIGNAREREPVARALRPPLQLVPWSRLGRWPTQGLQRSDSPNPILRIMFCSSAGKCGTLRERCRTSTVVSLLLGGGKAGREIHERCGTGGWPVPHLFLESVFAADLRGFARRINQLLKGPVFSGLPQHIGQASQLLHKSFGVSLCIRLC
jgi:hypothetical protein